MEKKSAETVETRTEPRGDMDEDASRISTCATRVGSGLKRAPKAVAAAGPSGAVRTRRSAPGAPSTRSRAAGIPLGSRPATLFFAALVAPSARRRRGVVPPSDEDVGGWNASKATTTSIMFWNVTAFNADIDDWDISSFADVPSFDRAAVPPPIPRRADLRRLTTARSRAGICVGSPGEFAS